MRKPARESCAGAAQHTRTRAHQTGEMGCTVHGWADRRPQGPCTCPGRRRPSYFRRPTFAGLLEQGAPTVGSKSTSSTSASTRPPDSGRPVDGSTSHGTRAMRGTRAHSSKFVNLRHWPCCGGRAQGGEGSQRVRRPHRSVGTQARKLRKHASTHACKSQLSRQPSRQLCLPRPTATRGPLHREWWFEVGGEGDRLVRLQELQEVQASAGARRQAPTRYGCGWQPVALHPVSPGGGS